MPRSDDDHKRNVFQRGERVDSVASMAQIWVESIYTSTKISYVTLSVVRDEGEKVVGRTEPDDEEGDDKDSARSFPEGWA